MRPSKFSKIRQNAQLFHVEANLKSVPEFNDKIIFLLSTETAVLRTTSTNNDGMSYGKRIKSIAHRLSVAIQIQTNLILISPRENGFQKQ